jgi:type IV pilus assembly protein PilZ
MSDADHQSVLTLTIQDKAALHGAYMSFLNNGGLFVPTARSYRLGDEVFLLLSLMDEPEKLPVAGRVVWITPKGAQGNRQAGIGIEFSDQDAGITATIENYLGGSLASDRVTHTL